MHTKNAFSKTRAVILGLTGLIDLVLAILFLVIVVSDWAAFDLLQKTISLALFFINVFSAVLIAFMCILRSRLRPLGDLGRGVVLTVFQIGSIVTFTLAAPSLPCAVLVIESPHSCRVLLSAILYGTCLSCALLVLFFLFLFPVLRLSRSQFVLPQSAEKPKSPMSDTASALTYYSWDRNPEKSLKHFSMGSHYSQGSYLPPYNPSSYGGKQGILAQKPYTTVQRNDGVTASRVQAASNTTSPTSTLATLRPYTPPPSDPATGLGPGKRISGSSIGSQDSMYAASWLMEPPRAVLSPKLASTSLSQDRKVYVPEGRGSHVNPREIIPPSTKNFPIASPPLTSHRNRNRKPKPQMLSIDSAHSSDSGMSDDVPRSPSPIDPYSPHSPFHSTPPSSGLLPKHPRLTMHLRDAARAQSLSPRMT